MFDEELFIAIFSDCPNINDEYSLWDVISTHSEYYASREEAQYWFHFVWRDVPENYLYATYKSILDSINIIKGRVMYLDLFKPKILARIMELNQHDTVNNPTLISLLDEEGFLTVYHGRCSKTMHNANSWSLEKDDALAIGRINALFDKSDDFYCVTGKVRLSDIIATIHGRNGKGVAVLQKNVKRTGKEIFLSSEVEVPDDWHYRG